MMNFLKKLGQKLGPEKFSLVFERQIKFFIWLDSLFDDLQVLCYEFLFLSTNARDTSLNTGRVFSCSEDRDEGNLVWALVWLAIGTPQAHFIIFPYFLFLFSFLTFIIFSKYKKITKNIFLNFHILFYYFLLFFGHRNNYYNNILLSS